MNGLQEWRDRCARAMGGVLYSINGVPKAWTGGLHGLPYEDWQPDTDYNHAMMMSRRCLESGKPVAFIRGLVKVGDIGRFKSVPDNRLRDACIAFSTAREIADAALKVLEG